MEKRQQLVGSLLKYEKRRYDGGSEIELIRNIESRQDELAALQSTSESSLEYLGQENPLNTAENKSVHIEIGNMNFEDKNRSVRVTDILLRGPLQICIGFVGIMTATLAWMTFRRLKNETMTQQSRIIIRECIGSVWKGAVDIFMTPFRLTKALTVG